MDTQLINFTIPKKLLNKFDSLADKKSASRSELLRQAVRTYIETEKMRKSSFYLVRESAERNDLVEEDALQLGEEAKKWARRNAK